MDVNASGLHTVFGPVPSRRFGRSLGVDVIPKKLCSMDCVYCEVGRTTMRDIIRKEYIPTSWILRELALRLALRPPIDCVTFSGSGEPTLHAGLGHMICMVKGMTDVPVVVLTNGSLLWKEDVRQDLLAADIVSPSLDAVSEDIFRRVDRPHPRLSAVQMIDGMCKFRKEFKGTYLLEMLFVSGINDGDEEVLRLRDAAKRIAPDKIQVNTILRPPAESWAKPVDHERLLKIRDMLGPTAEIIAPTSLKAGVPSMNMSQDDVLALLRRRAMTVDEIAEAANIDRQAAETTLAVLRVAGLATLVDFGGRQYFDATRD